MGSKKGEMSIMGSDAMVGNAKPRMVDEDESPTGGETLDREKLPVSKFLRNPHLTVNIFVVPDSARSNTNNSSLFNLCQPGIPRKFRATKSIRLFPTFKIVAKIISPLTLQSSD